MSFKVIVSSIWDIFLIYFCKWNINLNIRIFYYVYRQTNCTIISIIDNKTKPVETSLMINRNQV